jgi:hypothetical protein
MRAFAIAFIIAALPLGAGAQQPSPETGPSQGVLRMPPAFNLTPDDKQVYCFWAGQLYSLGASFCSRQQSSVTCTEWPGKRPIWVVKDNDKACDKNPSLTPL